MSEVIPPGKPIKLVAWQLDDPGWRATLAGGVVEPGLRALIAQLDEHGILQSVVTRRAEGPVRGALERLGLAAFFLVPQLGNAALAAAVTEIAQRLNLSLDATLVIGGDPRASEPRGGSEAGEASDAGGGREARAAARALRAVLPQVRSVAFPAPSALAALRADPLLGESLARIAPRPRRLVYLEEQARAAAERSFVARCRARRRAWLG